MDLFIGSLYLQFLSFLDAMGCPDIPVYRGATEALVVPDESNENYHGVDGFNDVEFDDEPDVRRVKNEMAASAISRLVKQFPGEVDLIAVGPLTNVAIAMSADPDLADNLHQLFIMGGNIEGIGNVTSSAEFNFHADPEAAFTVLR